MRFNLLGLAIFLVAAAVAEGLVRVLGSANRDLQFLFAGVLLAMLDIMVRSWRGARLFGRGGGAIMFVPVWLWGLIVLAGGIVSVVRSA